MKALVFGKTGQVASELRRLAAGAGVDVVALGRAEADLDDPGTCARRIRDSDADVVINAAAYTAVDQAESEPKSAHAVNAVAPATMARAAAERGVPFLHVSTDYVFDGSGSTPWVPDAETKPLSVYGRTKLTGELGVASAGGRFCILRTSWVFSSHGENFVKSMLRLSETRSELTIVADQVGGPTPAASIAVALLTIAKASGSDGFESGIHHFAGSPDTTWAEFAREIFRQARRDVVVRDILTTAYPTPALRPRNSRLNCGSLETAFGIRRPDWREGVAMVLEEMRANGSL